MKPIADIIESYSYQGLYQLNEGCISHLMPRLIVERRRSEPRQKPKQCRSGRLVGTNSNWGNEIGKYWRGNLDTPESGKSQLYILLGWADP